MQNFNIGSLHQWFPVAMGELYSFDVDPGDIRRVEFEFIADKVVTVSAISDDNLWIVGHGDGLCSVKFTTDRVVGICVEGDPSAVVLFKTRVATQVIADDGSVSYTTIEPRGPRQSDEVKRMMLMMRLNQQRREAALRAEMEERFRERDEQVIERAPTLEERQRAEAEAAAAAAAKAQAEAAPE